MVKILCPPALGPSLGQTLTEHSFVLNLTVTMASEDTPLIAPSSKSAPSAAGSRAYFPDSVYNDQPHHMTLGRRLTRHLSNFSWYNPHITSKHDNRPSLDAAWAYFEHVTLARHFLPGSRHKADEPVKDFLRKAEPGERVQPTRLYHVFSTPESDLADFGVGVGVYFFTLRSLCIIMFLAGLINIPNLMYFGSDAYNGVHEDIHFRALKTSAICTDSTWVACPTCTKDQWNGFPATYERYAETADGLTFTLRNNCRVNATIAMGAYCSLLFVCISIYVLQKITKRRERFLDEASQTSTDYAVEVVNPPKDAHDPEEWRTFFEQFGHVTCCTVALDNEELIAALVARRGLLFSLENLQPAGTVFDQQDLDSAVAKAQSVPWYWKFIGYMDAETIQAHIVKLEEQILSDLAKRDYEVSNVFVIYETEESQQEALKQMAVLGIDVMRNNTSALPRNLVFRGEYVLSVKEPPEPSSVRWQDLDETRMKQLAQRLVTFVLTVLTILGGCLLVTYVRFVYGVVYAAFAVTAVNTIAPEVCQFITEYESHSSEGSKQSSLYYKITACLWINTAIITALITPFVDTLEEERDSLIPAMLAIFITEMFKAPVTQLLDIPGHIKRHILAPRSVDQRRTNVYFQGTSWLLSERYTDMTNVLFLTFYYAFLFPAGFFFAAMTLAIHYWTDKFCLLRNWAPAPMLGGAIADMSRIYFFSSAVAVYAVVSSYNLASFPYDNACVHDTVVSSNYVGTFNAMSGTGVLVTVQVSEGDHNYFYCDQDMLHYHPPVFPAIPSNQPLGGEWMSEDQHFASVFGWTSVGVVIFVIGIFLNALRRCLAPIFFRVYRLHTTERRNRSFSEILDIFAYVPQTRVAGDPFPVLLCDVSGIDYELIGWEDPDQSYEKHSAIYDLPGLNEANLFSVIRHWPPTRTD